MAVRTVGFPSGAKYRVSSTAEGTHSVPYQHAGNPRTRNGRPRVGYAPRTTNAGGPGYGRRYRGSNNGTHSIPYLALMLNLNAGSFSPFY